MSALSACHLHTSPVIPSANVHDFFWGGARGVGGGKKKEKRQRHDSRLGGEKKKKIDELQN